MKKFVSLVLAAVLCAFSIITVYAAPQEYKPVYGNISIEDGEHIISESYDVTSISCINSSTLTIGKNAVIKADGIFAVDPEATLIVLGTLDLSDADHSENLGTVRIACCGKLIMDGDKTPERTGWDNEPINVGHEFVGGVCQVCGCTSTGSTLSEGSLTVIVGVAGIAVGFLAAMFIFKKKKPALADGAETDEE